MDVKLNKEFLFVFKEFLGFEYLLIEEVYNFFVDWKDIIVILLLSGIFI